MSEFIWTDGFDHWALNPPVTTAYKYDAFGSGGTLNGGLAAAVIIGSGQGRASASDSNTGGFYCFTGNWNGGVGQRYFSKALGANYSTLYAGLWIKFTQPGGGVTPGQVTMMLAFRDATTTQVDLRINSDGSFQFTRNGTAIGPSSAPNVIVNNQGYYVEMHIIFAGGTGGSVELKVNGTTWISATGINTIATANAWFNDFLIGALNSTAANWIPWAFNYDDFYIRQSAYCGDCRVNGQVPTGNGTLNQWTSTFAAWPASTAVVVGTQILDSNGNVQCVTSISGTGTTGGSAPTWNVTVGGTTTDNAGANQVVWTNKGTVANYKAVNELPNPDDDFSYVTDATVGDQDRYTYASISGSSVFTVVVWARPRKDDAGTRAIRLVADSAGTVGDNGADISVGSSYVTVPGVFDNDPHTGVAWTVASVNAAEFGVKVIA